MPSDPAHKAWPPWRLTMLAGSILLLLLAVLNATLSKPLPGAVSLILGGAGYAGLIIGFGLAMNSKRSRDKNP